MMWEAGRGKPGAGFLEDASTVRPPLVRFTIRGLMIAVAIVAGLLALSRWPEGLVVAFGLLYLSLIVVLWRMFRGFRRLSALCFGVVATVANIGCAALCISSLNMGGAFDMILGWFISFPMITATGGAWASAATRRIARSRRAPLLAWPLVLAAALAPLSILLTPWPLHLAFLASRPALDRLADRVAAGQGITSPEWAGLFRVVGSAVDPSSGNVGLIIDPDPSGHSGFVRVGAAPSVPAGRSSGPFYNLYLDLKLCDRWRYECED